MSSPVAGSRSRIDHAQLEVDRIIAIGDGDNDVEMLEFADLAIAVEGGHEAPAKVADHMISAPDRGGWADLLKIA
jgi:hydroxymethylpyrimidine pyrophosphatase-like HAD family hydrolase